jgi:CubicO group peptidase (beta-lactamase class C family)
MACSGRSAALLISLFFAFVAPATAAPEGGDAAFTSAAAKAVETVERGDGFSGVILVARGDRVLLRKAAGFADRERNIPNTPETKFPLASVTKQFTAAAIMLLVDEGKISLEDPISKYYPTAPPSWSKVRIKHLLSNSSGIEDYWIHRGGLTTTGQLWRSYEELIQLAIDDPLAFEPGTGFSYSNTGFALLTIVIERVSGQRYADFMRRRIFEPLGMHNTGYGRVPDNAVRGYLRSAEGELRETDVLSLLDTLGGFGGIHSTLDDMLTWSQALFGGNILSTDARKALLTDYGHNYGFGWRFAPKFGRPLIWHTGAGDGMGFAAIFDRFPDDDLTVVVMTNTIGPTDATATLQIEGKVTTFPANAARKLVEQIEPLYFGRSP